jgi:hypothetical protein
MAQIGVSHWKEGNRRTVRRPSVVNFMVFIRENASADTRAPYPPRYAMNFLLVNATAVPVFRTRYGRPLLMPWRFSKRLRMSHLWGTVTIFKCTWGRSKVTSQSASSREKTARHQGWKSTLFHSDPMDGGSLSSRRPSRAIDLGSRTPLPRRHRAFRHRDIGFSDWAVNFVRARGSLEAVREQKPLQRDAVGPDALQRGDVLDL